MKYLSILLLVGSIFASEGKVFVTSDPVGAEVRANDKALGKTPTILTLPAGDVVLVFVLNGYRAEGIKTTVVSGEITKVPPVTLAATKEPHNVDIVFGSNEWKVSVDGQPVLKNNSPAFTPTTIKLEEGKHEICLEKFGFRSVSKRVTVTRDEVIEFKDQPVAQNDLVGRWEYRIPKTNFTTIYEFYPNNVVRLLGKKVVVGKWKVDEVNNKVLIIHNSGGQERINEFLLPLTKEVQCNDALVGPGEARARKL